MTTVTITESTARDKIAEKIVEAATHPEWSLVFFLRGDPTAYKRQINEIDTIHLASDYIEIHLLDVGGPTPGGWTFFRRDDISRIDVIIPGLME